MSRNQRALSTKDYYDRKALDFFQEYNDFKTKDFKRFLENERDNLQSNLQNGYGSSDKKSCDERRYIFPLLSAQTAIYIETMALDLGCCTGIHSEPRDGIEHVSKKEYEKRLSIRHKLVTKEDLPKFTNRQKMIEVIAFISALLRQLIYV